MCVTIVNCWSSSNSHDLVDRQVTRPNAGSAPQRPLSEQRLPLLYMYCMGPKFSLEEMKKTCRGRNGTTPKGK